MFKKEKKSEWKYRGSDEILMQLNDADKPAPVIGTPRPTNSIIRSTHPFLIAKQSKYLEIVLRRNKVLETRSSHRIHIFEYIGSDFIK